MHYFEYNLNRSENEAPTNIFIHTPSEMNSGEMCTDKFLGKSNGFKQQNDIFENISIKFIEYIVYATM